MVDVKGLELILPGNVVLLVVVQENVPELLAPLGHGAARQPQPIHSLPEDVAQDVLGDTQVMAMQKPNNDELLFKARRTKQRADVVTICHPIIRLPSGLSPSCIPSSAFVVQCITINLGAFASEAELVVGVGWHLEDGLVPHPVTPDLQQDSMKTKRATLGPPVLVSCAPIGAIMPESWPEPIEHDNH